MAPIYTGGGAVDLVAAGALLTGTLRSGQARIAVLAALLAAGSGTDGAGLERADAAETLRRILAAPAQSLPASELYLVDGVRK